MNGFGKRFQMNVLSMLIVLMGMGTVLLNPSKCLGEPPSSPLSSAIQQAQAATVGILRYTDGGGESLSTMVPKFSIRGTGVHVGEGYLLTARHAVERPEGGKVVIPHTITVLTDDFEELTAGLIGSSSFLDMAVYRLPQQEVPSSLEAAAFSPEEAGAGDEVFTVGYPLGWGPALGYGRVGNRRTFLPTAQSRLIQLDLSACSGNSGGGMFNHHGQLVGMIQSIIQTEQSREERRCSRLAFAVPGPLVHKIAKGLIAGEHPGFPKLGIHMTAVKMGTRWQVAVDKATGPARRAGLRQGDVVLSIEGHAIHTAAQLKNYLIEQTRPHQKIRVKVLRGGKERELMVTLGKS